MSYEVHDFIREALAKGASKNAINTALNQAGWQDAEIKSALNAFSEGLIVGLPVPRPQSYTSAKEGFLYLLLFVTLYISAINFGSLLFSFINMAFPDPLNEYSEVYSIRFAVSSLIVAFPTFLWLTLSMNKAITLDPRKQSSKIRKWLISITLFIAATIIVCDLIGLLVGFLGGELSLRFILKAGTIFMIAALAFGYYRWDLSRYDGGA